MRYGYNRVFLDGVLADVRVTRNGVWFLLDVWGDVAIDCGSSRAVVISTIANADLGDRFFLRGTLRVRPTRVVVDDVLVLSAKRSPEEVPASAVVRASPQEEVTVKRHPRTLRSGRVVWVKPHVRGKRQRMPEPDCAAAVRQDR